MNTDFGSRVKQLRLERYKKYGRYWSINSLAKRIGISAQALSLIENGKTKNPNMEIIKKLSIEFNVSTDYLIFGNEPQCKLLVLEIPCNYYINQNNIKITLKDK